MISYRRNGRSSRSHTYNKNRRNRPNQTRGYPQNQGQTNSHSGNHNRTSRPVNMVLSHPRQPPRLPRLLRGSTSGQPTIRAKTPTCANQVPFAPATDRATAVRLTRHVCVDNNSFGFARCSSACRSPYMWCGINYFC